VITKFKEKMSTELPSKEQLKKALEVAGE